MINWAQSETGTTLINFSSQVYGCEAENLLNPDIDKIWLTEEGFNLPHWICLKLDEDKAKGAEIRTIGWHCWHSYITNPKTVRVHVSNDGLKFKYWDTFEAQSHLKGSQLFYCSPPVNTNVFNFIALEIQDTFGAMQTYMNKLYLFSDEVDLGGLNLHGSFDSGILGIYFKLIRNMSFAT